MIDLVALTGHRLVKDLSAWRQPEKSTLRELVLRQRFLGDLGAELFDRGIDFAVLQSDIDRDGYDVVIETNTVIRHIQLKTSIVGGKTREVPVNTRLANKPSGCVVWSVFDPDVRSFAEHRWFGDAPGEKLPDLGNKAVLHTNAAGVKVIKPDLRAVTAARCERLFDIDTLADRLFGEMH